MLRIILLLVALISVANAGRVWVNGYFRKDGTYVQGHWRTEPDNTTLNNWSTQGNYNPYTGEYGTKDPNSNFCPQQFSEETCLKWLLLERKREAQKFQGFNVSPNAMDMTTTILEYHRQAEAMRQQRERHQAELAEMEARTNLLRMQVHAQENNQANIYSQPQVHPVPESVTQQEIPKESLDDKAISIPSTPSALVYAEDRPDDSGKTPMGVAILLVGATALGLILMATSAD